MTKTKTPKKPAPKLDPVETIVRMREYLNELAAIRSNLVTAAAQAEDTGCRTAARIPDRILTAFDKEIEVALSVIAQARESVFPAPPTNPTGFTQ